MNSVAAVVRSGLLGRDKKRGVLQKRLAKKASHAASFLAANPPLQIHPIDFSHTWSRLSFYCGNTLYNLVVAGWPSSFSSSVVVAPGRRILGCPGLKRLVHELSPVEAHPPLPWLVVLIDAIRKSHSHLLAQLGDVLAQEL